MKAAFFDVDGTLTKTRVWLGLLEYFKSRGKRRVTHLAFWLTHYPLYFLYRLGLLSQTGFRAPWAKHLPWFFRGYRVEQAEAIWEWVVGEFLSEHWRSDTRSLLEGHKQSGDLVVLVSAGPVPLLRRIGDEIGAEHAIGTTPRVREGRYTGGVEGPVCIDENKALLPKAYFSQHGIEVDFKASFAYADAPGDLPLLEMVGNPVAVYPDEELRPIAEARGWRILPE